MQSKQFVLRKKGSKEATPTGKQTVYIHEEEPHPRESDRQLIREILDRRHAVSIILR